MDKKSISLISKIHRKILSHSFDENDIFILLVLVREEAATNRDYSKIEWEYGFLREICDFIAHRYRNKGFAFEEARYIYQRCTTTGVFHFDTESKRNIISGMFEDVIIKELNEIFLGLSLAPIPSIYESEVILCIISLLQFAKIETDNMKVNGYLYAEINDDGIYLLYDIFEAGFSPAVLQVEDEQYCHLVDSPLSLNNDCFSLERVGTALKVVLPK